MTNLSRSKTHSGLEKVAVISKMDKIKKMMENVAIKGRNNLETWRRKTEKGKGLATADDTDNREISDDESFITNPERTDTLSPLLPNITASLLPSS